MLNNESYCSFYSFIYHRFWKIGKYSSTGLTLFTTAVAFCDKISLYGFYPFDKDSHGKPLKYHYFDETTVNFKTSMHKMPQEYRELVTLRDRGVIRLVTDKCNHKCR